MSWIFIAILRLLRLDPIWSWTETKGKTIIKQGPLIHLSVLYELVSVSLSQHFWSSPTMETKRKNAEWSVRGNKPEELRRDRRKIIIVASWNFLWDLVSNGLTSISVRVGLAKYLLLSPPCNSKRKLSRDVLGGTDCQVEAKAVLRYTWRRHRRSHDGVLNSHIWLQTVSMFTWYYSRQLWLLTRQPIFGTSVTNHRLPYDFSGGRDS